MAIVALPAAAGVIWALLRSPATRRLVAVPSADRWHDSPTPSFGGIGIFAGFSAGLWGAAAAGAFDPTSSSGSTPRSRSSSLRGSSTTCSASRRSAKLAAQGAAAAIVLATGTHVQLVHNEILGDAIAVVWLIGVTNAFNLLDNMDGLAATLASIAFFFFAVDAVTVHPTTPPSPSRSPACSRASAFYRSTSARAAARSSSWATPGARRSGSRSPRSASSRAGASPERPSPPHPAGARPRRADPRHDARHDRPPARRAPDPPGRAATTPRTASSASASPSGTRSRCSR